MNYKNELKKEKQSIKKPDFKSFVAHVEFWNDNKIPYSLTDLKELAKKYNTPEPKEEELEHFYDI